MVDYFASRGSNSAKDQTADKLGKQLKSLDQMAENHEKVHTGSEQAVGAPTKQWKTWPKKAMSGMK